jgi:hypothetical protein
MSLSKRATTLAASTRSGGEQDGGLRPVHRTSIGSATKGAAGASKGGKGGRGTSTKK